MADADLGPVIDELFCRLLERDYAQNDPKVTMLTAALINILGHKNRGDRPTEVLLMVACGGQGVVDRQSLLVMRWRNGALSGSDFAHEPGVSTTRMYKPGEMRLPARPRPSLRTKHRFFHQEMSSEAASFSSQLKAAVPAKRPRVEKEEVQTNETMENLNETKDELDRVRKIMVRT